LESERGPKKALDKRDPTERNWIQCCAPLWRRDSAPP
jgi:hypothetical protein